MDPVEKRSLVKKRAVIKSRVTRIFTFVNSFKDGSNLNDIRVRQSQLTTSKDEYNDIQTQLEINDLEESHDADRESFEDLCLDIESKIATLLESNAVVTPHSASSCSAHEIKLPAISLPKFNGNVAEFMHFFDTFKALVISNDALTDVQRYYYLLSCVSGEPRKLIENLPVTESNFKVAWDLIVQRYNNPKLIVDLHVKELLNLPNVKNETAKDLRMLINLLMTNLNAIEVMQVGIPLHEVLLSHMLLDRITVNLRKQWESKTGDTTFPRLKQLVSFLETSCQTLERVHSDRTLYHSQQPVAKRTGTKAEGYNSQRSFLATASECEFCNSNHKLSRCLKFKESDITTRINFVTTQKLCFNCLGTNHRQKECRAGSCRICNKRHNTLLHREQASRSGDVRQETGAPQQQTYCTVKQNYQHAETLLSTLLLNIADKKGKMYPCRALLDSASQMNFISSSLADRMGLQLSRHPIPISGISDVKTIESSHVCEVYVSSRVADYRTKAVCALLPRITGLLPAASLEISSWKLLKHIMLADPTFNEPGEIDLLLGASIFFDALKAGQLKKENYPTLQETSFGWIVSGKVPPQSMKYKTRSILSCLARSSSLNMQVERFWQQEEVKSVTMQTKEERLCEEHFERTIQRNVNGRYVVKLPIKVNHAGLGDSITNATSCFRRLERRLQRQPELKARYVNFMREYEDLGHMELVTSDTENCTYYMPHHAVLKDSSSTTKLRVVFNASAKTSSNTSLNDILMVGPTVQDDLYSIVLRFRTHRYAFTADITKMYRQIEVRRADKDLQRILWRESPNEPIRAYRLTTVTYGTAAAPYLATRCLLQLAEDERATYPRAANILQTDFYVDDVLSGADTMEEALSLQEELIRLLNSGGFPLRKWCANDSRLLETIPLEHRETQIPWSLGNEKQETVKTLGLLWYPPSDTFQFLATEAENSNASWTKRRVLSRIASIFDPLGLLGPVVVTCKMFLQHLWQRQIEWDQPLSEDLQTQWEQINNHLPSLNNIHIERRVVNSGAKWLELHGFSDASERAYGACVYLRSVCEENDFSVKLLSSKSRVAPIKQISLPRLELCAALLLARLMEKIKTGLHLKITKTYFWTDSTVVLAWLAKEPTSWKTFVGNRVSEIHQLSAVEDWNHVSSRNNPADNISRGIAPQHLGESKLWWTGPSWLYQSPSAWPISTVSFADDIPEKRTQNVCVLVTTSFLNEIAERYSSWSKLQRVMAYVLRYINNLRRPHTERHSGSLTAGELNAASKTVIRIVQHQNYGKEIEELQLGRTIPKKSKLNSLHPFLDEEQLLRVGGRLELSKVSYSQKHPIILPPKHHVTKLIVMAEHLRLLHPGAQLLLASLRQRYWIPNGRSVIRQIIHKCLPCYRLKATTATQLMGQLPSVRVSQSRPFLNCGVDYGGPLYVRNGGKRSKTRAKVYIALFVCMATKAVHIELVTDLSSQAFIAALRRFISRRGVCANLYSDNGKTFVGARNELHELFKLFSSELFATQIENYASQNGIQWHFIPPHAPHFGGLWEAGIKSVKTHLKRVVGNKVLTFEELYTLLTQIEACLNSRPITQLSDNPDEFSYLTPGHFLIGEPLTAVPEPGLLPEPLSRLSRWQLIQQCKQHVWKRWSNDYLSQLQQRTKWSSTKDNLQPGTLVLLKEDNLPPLVWRSGVIACTHPGPDGLVRVVSVRTATGTYKRPLSKICVVPQET